MAGESTVVGSGAEAQAAVVAKRLDWVDAAKGIGIITVVIAHVWTRGPVRDFIYSFHMPLFFLLSGYMFRPRPMAQFLPRLAQGMAIPYAAFLLSLALFDWGFESLRGNHPIFRDAADALWRLTVGGSELRGPFTIFWFAPCLFFARIIQNFIAGYWPDPRDWRWCAVGLTAFVIGWALGLASDFSPLGLLSMPVAVGLLWVGALWRTVEPDRRLIAVAAMASVAVIVAGATWGPVPLNMKVGDYGVPALSLAGAVALSLALGGIARLADWNPLCALGRMSLVIMYVHVAVIHYAAPYASKPLLLLAALAFPIVLDRLFSKNATSRRLFLGQ
ncbi:acyltransferase family protein [Sphingobium subterraneum]|uniref:Fucose 4-O-acetylase-like acetyltransferase n=1 Tax=Sphingobium subterraneum TaxID=627688 RepID=A0A841J1Y0_9SPHN|nr:acyltransferase family protein [Sphingobium subterraneum]MBB6124362.1 fucose 4-O-acetylase-like acetyltransferase [Sphingobium subterraneum]